MNRSSFFTSLFVAVFGGVLVITGATQLSRSESFEVRNDPVRSNPFGIYRSAYGSLLARLGETTIDRIWHLGVEQIVPHYMSGEAHDPVGSADYEDKKPSKQLPSKPILELAKSWIQKRVVSQHSRTNPYSLSAQHKHSVHRDLERLMRRSYRLDPTHYGAYNSYHLFITTHEYGGDARSREFAKTLAKHTIANIQGENENPEAYLTAASASMNLFLLETEDARVKGEKISLASLHYFRDQISGFLEQFERLQDQAQDSGRWDYVSTDRQVEIAQRYRFTKKTFGQFDAMIARAESDLGGPAEAEVAGKEE